ncbi:MAG: ATP-binding protein [Eubacteriales bacterium]|nr:ATP-binding protein [Eubacteriales bacterium]
MQITEGKINSPLKIVVYGPEGIGKSTFASQLPDPLFIDTEGSTKFLDVKRLDRPTSWAMLMQQVQWVKSNKPCKTLVIDTADWAETLCKQHICASNNVKSIEEFGYGKGYTYLAEEWGRLLNSLTDVVEAGTNVLLTAHAMMRKFEQPDELGAYDRWELKLEKKTAPMTKEWADLLLFANYKTTIITDSKTKSKIATGGQRVMYTTHHPAWDAKNRHGLPEELPFMFKEISTIFTPNEPVSDSPLSTPTDKPPKDMPEATPEAEAEPATTPAPASRVPKDLRDLMVINQIVDPQLETAIGPSNAGGLGYFPAGVKLEELPEDFYRYLVSNFDEFKQHIAQNLNLPFDI